jgi:hypothetical protein
LGKLESKLVPRIGWLFVFENLVRNLELRDNDDGVVSRTVI